MSGGGLQAKINGLDPRVVDGLKRLRETSVGPWGLLGFAALLSFLTWMPSFDLPTVGLDPSWHAGLFMAAEEGLDSGTDVVFTYGPLGFLGLPTAALWSDGLALLAFSYLCVLQLGYCLALLWALQRTMGLALAVVVSFIAICLFPTAEQVLVLAAAAGLSALVRDPPKRALDALTYLGPPAVALELLIKLSLGPTIFAMLVVALIGARASNRRLAVFGAGVAFWLVALWLIAGQSLSSLPDFLTSGVPIISGYGEAMGAAVSPSWQLYVSVVAAVGLVSLTAIGAFPDRRGRIAAVVVMAIVAYVVFKEGVVRFETNHVVVMLSSLGVLALLVPVDGLWRILPLVVAGALFIVTLNLGIPGYSPSLDPIDNVDSAHDQLDLAFSPDQRADGASFAKSAMKSVYDLDDSQLGQLAGRRTAIDPWEIGIAWAYDLDWQPLPVMQGYAAYEEDLDELNAVAVASSSGPDRILRVNPVEVVGELPTRGLDNRFPSWDPPAQAVATLCNFETLSTSQRFQVLGRTEDRCGDPVSLGSTSLTEGEALTVPEAGPDEVIFARVDGAGLDVFEHLRAAAIRAPFRFAIVDGDEDSTYRLVPGTAEDGLLLNGDPRVVGRGPFAQAPQAQTLAISGAGDVEIELLRMRVEPAARDRS